METTEQKITKTYRTLENDPQFFGGYLNMARLNVFIIGNHIAQQFGQTLLNEDGEIKNSFLCNKNIKRLNWNHVFSKTVRFLPILKVFDFERLPASEKEKLPEGFNTGKDFNLMSDNMKVIFGELQDFRNDYSHHYSVSKGTTRKIKISKELTELLNINFSRAIEFTKERFKEVLNDEDFNLVASKKLVEADNTITTEGLVFLISMFLEKEHANLFMSKIKGLRGTQFKPFIATREVLSAFCIKLPHDRFVSEDKKQAFSLDLINTLNRCPKELYNVISDKEKQQFKPQLDEIEEKHLIENSLNDNYEIIDWENYIEALTRKIRHSNRFHYFALKFIDETNLFKNYRFQIQLGKLLIDKYEKQINGEPYPRTIVEDVKAFGKLSDFEDDREILQRVDKNSHSLGFEQFAPFYNKRNNKIGLHSGDNFPVLIYNPKSESKTKKNLKQPRPEAFLSLNELPKIILLEYFEKGKAEELIRDFILTNNSKIMNLQFIKEVKEKLPNDWNEFQKKADSKKFVGYKHEALAYLKSRKDILDKVLAEYNLNHKQIPTRILNYWLNITDVKKERIVSDRIKAMKRDCMKRLKNLEKYKKERKGKIPKIGEMASFLAKDIVGMLVSKDKKKTLTSFYYDKMQECLALCADPEKKSLFIELVNELKLNESGGHPFLKNIDLLQIRYTPDLYEKYLQEKGKKMVKIKNHKTGRVSEKDKSWMATTFYKKEWSEKVHKNLTVVKLPGDKSNIPFSIRQLEDKTSYNLNDWLNHITKGKQAKDGKKPINLPANLFDDTLVQLLQTKLDAQNIEYPENAKYNELFKTWWNSRGDDVQDFYKAEREYQIYDEPVKFNLQEGVKFADLFKKSLDKVFADKSEERKKHNKRATKKLPGIQFNQVEKVFKRTISNTEKEIRMVQEQDRIILLMIEKLFDSKNLKLKLNNIKSLLSDTITVEQPVTGKLSFNDSGEIVTGNNKPGITRIITDKRKRKDYSLLKKFVFDRRLPELFEYFPERKIAVAELKNELDMYNTAKQMVFDAAFELEKRIIDKNAEGVKEFIDDDNGFDNIQHKPYLEWLQNKGLINADEFTFLNMVRNCFAHNQFPQKKTMEKQMKLGNKNFAKQIAEDYKQKIDTILVKL